ncbi:hypothetical protein CLOM_g7175 [Closterium sp. NIES-68]|nr:hypothetical protein CLOM_g7175 [Closterium sp. NIES-68]GJP78980.1 hypothetical protein CLOP_g9237 [Closterium sp. NIES-67]
MALPIRRKPSSNSVESLPFTILLFAVSIAAAFLVASASAASLPGQVSSPANESPEHNTDATNITISAAELSDLVARKARAVEARRHALVLLRELRSLNDSVAAANARIQDALHARDKLKITSARLEEQRKVLNELSSLVDETARRMYKQRNSRGVESDEARLALVAAGEAKLEAERLITRISRKAMREREKVESYSVAMAYRAELAKAMKQSLQQLAEAEKKAHEGMQEYATAWQRAMASSRGVSPRVEADVLKIVEDPSETSREQNKSLFSMFSNLPSRQVAADASKPSSLMSKLKLEVQHHGGPGHHTMWSAGAAAHGSRKDSNRGSAFFEEMDSGPDLTDLENEREAEKMLMQQREESSRKRLEAMEGLAAADAEEAVDQALLNTLRAEIEAWKSAVAQARKSGVLELLRRRREELENAESDLEFAEFQVKGAEKDLEQANVLAEETAWLAEEQKKILQESDESLTRAMAAEVKTRSQRARMQRVEAELVKAQAERVWEEMRRWMRRDEALVLERTHGLQDAMAEREKAAKKAAEVRGSVEEMEERYGKGKGERTAKEADRLMKLLKPVVLAKRAKASAAKRAWNKLLTLQASQVSQ